LRCQAEDEKGMSISKLAYVRFVVLTAVTMKNGVFWDVTPCGSLRTDFSEEFSAFLISVTRVGVGLKKKPG
jgi:hypothetical protein